MLGNCDEESHEDGEIPYAPCFRNNYSLPGSGFYYRVGSYAVCCIAGKTSSETSPMCPFVTSSFDFLVA